MAYQTMPDGTRLFYTDSGQGQPVLLLHGWTCDGNDWSWQTPELERRYRVLNVDQRGHGRSDAPNGSYRPQVLAADAAALLEAVAPGQAAVVFGHSMGGIVASALAVSRPELVAGLVLVDPAYTASDEALARTLDAIRGPAPAAAAAAIFGRSFYTPDTPEFLKAWHRRRVLGTPDHVVAGCLLGLYDGDEALGRATVAQDYLRRRTAPRLAVYAAEAATRLERALPQGAADQIHVLPGGHFMHQQLASQFNSMALGWLGQWFAGGTGAARQVRPSSGQPEGGLAG
jgi:pimeloyl-ACP methyl ester carboxylesterase